MTDLPDDIIAAYDAPFPDDSYKEGARRFPHLGPTSAEDPATPTDNAYIESFNARLRQELLNVSWFTSPAEARACLEAWRKEYNEERPHTALNNRTPKQYLAEVRAAAKVA